MNDDTRLLKATHIEDPETGEVLTAEKDEEYSRLLNSWYQDECKHPTIAQFKVKIANGGFQVRDCCVECGDRIGTALPQKDKELVARLPWQPEEHAATYKSRRDAEWRSTLLDLARRQYAERGRFTKSYKDYMDSDAWRAKRALVFKRCGGVCEGCGVAKATEIHHIHYRHLGDEYLFELLGLCHTCHERISAERRARLGIIDDVPVVDDPDNLPH